METSMVSPSKFMSQFELFEQCLIVSLYLRVYLSSSTKRSDLSSLMLYFLNCSVSKLIELSPVFISMLTITYNKSSHQMKSIRNIAVSTWAFVRLSDKDYDRRGYA
jgi:FtsH-binding integral membrane protein